MKSIKIGLIFAVGFFLCSAALVDSAQAFSLGEKKVFNLDSSYDYNNRAKISATLRQVGDKALFYVEDDWWDAQGNPEVANQALLNLLDEFDKIIYPKLTQVFGSEWSPGIDNDPRITILITKMKDGAGGYFNSNDEYPASVIYNSNEREMIYLNSFYLDNPKEKSFLAHEFHHLINFYQKNKLRGVDDDIWLNEALSEYAATLCGYDRAYAGSGLEKRVNEFLRNPSDPLAEWGSQTADYGPINLFMQYFASRYGEQVISRIARSDAAGIESINRALAESGFSERFADIFANWAVANYVNDCRVGDGQKFCYLNQSVSLRVAPSISRTIPIQENSDFSFSDNIKDWSPRWYEFVPEGSGLNMILNFQGAVDFRAALVLTNGDGSRSVRFLKLDAAGSGSEMILNFGSVVKSAVLIPVAGKKTANFSSSDPAYPMTYKIRITSAGQISSPASPPSTSPSPSVSPNPVLADKYPDGSLIRARGDYKVYIIMGNYKRWIQSPKILAAYPHLGWQSIIEVTPQERDGYQDAWLVRADGDPKVYEINGDLTKHWLDMTAEYFSSSGRKWEMVFIINKTERDLYKTGVSVKK